MQEKDGSRECRIEVIRNEGCMHIWNLQERGLTIDLTHIHSDLPRIILSPQSLGNFETDDFLLLFAYDCRVCVNQNPDLLKTAGQATGSVEIPTLFIDPHCRSPRRYCQMPWRRQTIVSWR